MRTIVASCVVILSLIGATTANARTTEVQKAKARYYHASGIVKWIGNHAKVTQYNPNPVKRRHWQKAVSFWVGVRHEAWIVLHPQPAVADWLLASFQCIHRYEGAWDADTGNGYYGGLQMDLQFQGRYGATYLARWGTANNWPVWAQIDAAARAYYSGRGFGPWPNTARYCGLL